MVSEESHRHISYITHFSKGFMQVVELYYAGQKVEETAILKGNVLEACVLPACVYGLGRLALTETQEEKL